MAKTGIKITAEAEGGKARILISSVISEYEESSASGVRKIVDGFIAQGITEADIYINCKGGDVFEATEIDSQFERFTSVTFYIGSVAASAATYLTSNPKFRVVAKYNSQLMIHKPMLHTSGNIEEIRARIKMLENTTALYKSRYAAKTGMTGQDIDNMWANGDYWMNADEARQKGFVDEVLGAESAIRIEKEETLIAARASRIPGIPMTPPVVPPTRANWTLEDYLDKDPEALKVISETNPNLFAGLNEDYYGGKLTAPQKKAPNRPQVTIPAMRADWTLEDYLDKDPEALKVISETNPLYFEQLNGGYFSNNITAKSQKEKKPEKSSDRSKWTLDDWIEKDPEGLHEMAKKNTEEFQRLNNEYLHPWVKKK